MLTFRHAAMIVLMFTSAQLWFGYAMTTIDPSDELLPVLVIITVLWLAPWAAIWSSWEWLAARKEEARRNLQQAGERE